MSLYNRDHIVDEIPWPPSELLGIQMIHKLWFLFNKSTDTQEYWQWEEEALKSTCDFGEELEFHDSWHPTTLETRLLLKNWMAHQEQ